MDSPLGGSHDDNGIDAVQTTAVLSLVSTSPAVEETKTSTLDKQTETTTSSLPGPEAPSSPTESNTILTNEPIEKQTSTTNTENMLATQEHSSESHEPSLISTTLASLAAITSTTEPPSIRSIGFDLGDLPVYQSIAEMKANVQNQASSSSATNIKKEDVSSPKNASSVNVSAPRLLILFHGASNSPLADLAQKIVQGATISGVVCDVRRVVSTTLVANKNGQATSSASPHHTNIAVLQPGEIETYNGIIFGAPIVGDDISNHLYAFLEDLVASGISVQGKVASVFATSTKSCDSSILTKFYLQLIKSKFTVFSIPESQYLEYLTPLGVVASGDVEEQHLEAAEQQGVEVAKFILRIASDEQVSAAVHRITEIQDLMSPISKKMHKAKEEQKEKLSSKDSKKSKKQDDSDDSEDSEEDDKKKKKKKNKDKNEKKNDSKKSKKQDDSDDSEDDKKKKKNKKQNDAKKNKKRSESILDSSAGSDADNESSSDSDKREAFVLRKLRQEIAHVSRELEAREKLAGSDSELEELRKKLRDATNQGKKKGRKRAIKKDKKNKGSSKKDKKKYDDDDKDKKKKKKDKDSYSSEESSDDEDDKKKKNKKNKNHKIEKYSDSEEDSDDSLYKYRENYRKYNNKLNKGNKRVSWGPFTDSVQDDGYGSSSSGSSEDETLASSSRFSRTSASGTSLADSSRLSSSAANSSTGMSMDDSIDPESYYKARRQAIRYERYRLKQLLRKKMAMDALSGSSSDEDEDDKKKKKKGKNKKNKKDKKQKDKKSSKKGSSGSIDLSIFDSSESSRSGSDDDSSNSDNEKSTKSDATVELDKDTVKKLVQLATKDKDDKKDKDKKGKDKDKKKKKDKDKKKKKK